MLCSCGYDLTGHKSDAVCPECGRAVSVRLTASDSHEASWRCRMYWTVVGAFWLSTLALLGYVVFLASDPLGWLYDSSRSFMALPLLVILHLWAFRSGGWCTRLFNALAVSTVVVLVAMIPFTILLELSGV